MNWAALLAGLGAGLLIAAAVTFAAFAATMPQVNEDVNTLVNQTESKEYAAAVWSATGDVLGTLKAVQYNVKELRNHVNTLARNIVLADIALAIAGVASLILALVAKIVQKPAPPPPQPQ